MPDWIFQVTAMIGGGVAVYAGIRADIAAIHAKLDHIRSGMERAHSRIDEIYKKGIGQ